jgi:NADPH:quinone reductase-like Zn-dependent oxidoreductase
MSTVPGAAIFLQMAWTKLFGSKRAVFAATGTKSPTEKLAHLGFLKERLEAGEFRSVIGRTYPLEEIAKAHRHVDSGHKVGNVVVTME